MPNKTYRNNRLSHFTFYVSHPWIKRILISALLLALLLSVWTLWTFSGRFARDIYGPNEVNAIPYKPVAIVFGAGYWPGGRLSPMLQDRVDAAMELYTAGRIDKLLFSGDNRFVDYNEPASMLDYALEHGIPHEDIVLDYAGRRTYDTCYRARAIFQVDNAILVTQRYHLPRAIETCRAVGVYVDGYSADRQPYARRAFVYYVAREVLALWQAWIDVYIWHPVPVLGDPLPIFGEVESRK